MRQAAGQVARRTAGWLHLLLGIVTVALLALGAFGWRLTQGPLELPWLARAIEAAAAEEVGGRLEVGRAAIGWQGWREGHLTPVELRLSGVRLLDAGGTPRAELPDAALTLSLPWLLRGEVAPRVLELRGPELRLRRGADGAVTLMLDTPSATATEGEATGTPLDDLVAELMRPPSEETPRGALSALRIAGGRVLVEDVALGAQWALEGASIELRRLPAGGVAGRGSATLRLGAVALPVNGTVELTGAPAELRFRAAMPDVAPATLAAAAPALAPLARVDAPARIELTGRLGADGEVRALDITLAAGAGRIDVGARRPMVIERAEASAEYRPGRLALTRAVMRLPGTAPVTITAEGGAELVDGTWRGAVNLALDSVPFTDLPRHWPEGVGSGERAWITGNITAGVARNGRWRFEGEVPADLSAARLTRLSGTLDVADATVHWLRPIPPVERVQGQVTFGLTEIVARVTSGREAGTAVQARDTTLRFTFPDRQPPQADFVIGLAGPVPDVLAVLQHPRLRLFERRPLPLKEPGGTLDGRLTLAFPLIDALQVEQIRIRATARLAAVRLADVLMGRPLERGQLELNVDNDGLRVNGTATLADIPARVAVEMDFRPGPANGVIMRESVQARTDTRALAALGLDAEDLARGPVGVEARTERRRNGTGRAVVRADLREATMELDPLGWSKPPGQNAGAEIVLRLSGETLEAVDGFRVEAPGLMVRGTAAFGRGTRLERAVIQEAVVEGSRLAGEVRPPPRQGAPWSVVLRGPVLDLRRALAEDTAAPGTGQGGASGAAYAIDGRFERVVLGPRREVAGVEARVLIDGRGVVREGRLAGRAGPRGPFEATITPDGGGRALRVAAEDAGALLRAFDVLQSLEGGRLVVQARYAHDAPGAPLTGRAEMSDFAVHGAPGFAKLLQAMTLYGLVEALSGPGLGFSRLIAPFTLTPEALTLEEARAFSASLGLTAKGTLDRRRQRLAMEGTIVPAYIFNSLLGNIPIFGRLFSPEAGGGVFAATFRLSGPMDDPQVYVNPLAALTPGFLRGLFGIGQGAQQ